MKVKSALLIMVSIVFILVQVLVGCGEQPTKVAKADIPQGFTEVSQDEIPDGLTNDTIIELRNKETKCYYAYMRTGNGISLTEMYINDGGRTVPYCTE